MALSEVASAAGAAAGSAAHAAEQQQLAARPGACVVDCALRLLHLLASAGNMQAMQHWLQGLLHAAQAGVLPAIPTTTAPSTVGQLLQRAQQALLKVLSTCPGEAAIHWLSLAHVALSKKLPSAVFARLGYTHRRCSRSCGRALTLAPRPGCIAGRVAGRGGQLSRVCACQQQFRPWQQHSGRSSLRRRDSSTPRLPVEHRQPRAAA